LALRSAATPGGASAGLRSAAQRRNALLKEGDKSDKVDARKLA
jgi:hypothetical protein